MTNKNQVQTPSSEGEDFDGRFREGSSLALGSPDYRRQVLSDPRAHGYTVESDEKWAAFVSDKCQPLTPEEEAQHRVGWGDATMSAKTWFAMGDVRPADAAMLLCRFNPKKTKMKDAKQRTTDEPCDLALLVECLKDLGRTAPRFRTLLDWLDAAKQKNFPHHSWIDQYVAAVALLNPAPPPEPAAAATPDKQATPSPPASSAASDVQPAPDGAADDAEPQRKRDDKCNKPTALTTGQIAAGFDGLRWTAERWKKPLGDVPKWLKNCRVISGIQGVKEAQWDPVLIGAHLVRQGHAKARSVRAKFQSSPPLKPWLEAWKTYEADNFDTV